MCWCKFNYEWVGAGVIRTEVDEKHKAWKTLWL